MDKLPTSWKHLNFGELVDNFDGKRIPLSSKEREKRQGDIPYYGASGIIDYIDEHIFEGEHLLISEDGANLLARTYPIAFIVTGQFWVNNHAHIVKAKSEKTLNQYLRYYFASKNISEYVTGSAQPKLNQKNLNKIKIPLPPLPEQKRIVSKLDALFERIDKSMALLEENIKHTESLMASALDEVFNNLSYPNIAIKDLCINPKKDMVGGPFGSNLKATEYEDSGFPIIRLQNVDRFNFLEKNINFVTKEKAEFLSSHSFKSGDIVLTKLGDPLGKCCVVNDVCGIDRGVISSDIIRIRINEKKYCKPFVVSAINSSLFMNQLISKTQGSTRPRVTLKEVREMQIPVPDLAKQVKIADNLDSLYFKRQVLLSEQQDKLKNLKALKESILDKAFKGEI